MSDADKPANKWVHRVAADPTHWKWREGASVNALISEDYVYVGGQVSLSHDGTIKGAADIEVQTKAVFVDLMKLLEASGSSMKDLVKLHTYYVFKGDGRDVTRYWERMTAVRLKYLADPGPAATAVRVLGAPEPELLIAVDGIAAKSSDKQRLMPIHTWDWSIPTPFSQGWRAGKKIFVGGQISADMQGKAIAPDNVVAQTENALELIRHVLIEGGAAWSDLVTLRICYKHDGSHAHGNLYGQICNVICETIPAPRPIVTAFGADLLYEGLLLEVDGIASLEKPRKAVNLTGITETSDFPDAWQIGEELFFSIAPDVAGRFVHQLASVIVRIRSLLHSGGGETVQVVKLTAFYIDNPVDGGAGVHLRQQMRGAFSESTITFVQVSDFPGKSQLLHVDGVCIGPDRRR